MSPRMVSRRRVVRRQEDELDPARGLIWGSLIGVGLWLLAFAGLALLLAGCAPVVHGGTPEYQAQVLQSWQELLAVRPIHCTLKAVYIVARPGLTANVSPGCVIRVGLEFVRTSPPDQVRAALAHEQGHILHHDGGGILGNNRPQIERERLADIEAAHTLAMISPEACLALPRLFEAMSAGGVSEGKTHPLFSERIATTGRICSEERVARGQAADGGTVPGVTR